jgi:peptidoglycan/LPS O-acetylase OafA/YrhL
MWIYHNMTLEKYAENKNNNFDILRFIFAFAVLFGHSFPISGNGSDPLSMLLLPNTWIGAIAVDGFFAISGFLVTSSIINRSILSFIVSRVLRIYPAVIIYCLLTIFIIGPLGTKASLQDYFAASPLSYFFNASLWEWKYNLPLVFPDNPHAGSTNGSGWTLPIEIRCYLLVLLFGFFGVFDNRIRANVAIFFIAFIVFVYPTDVPVFMFNGEIRNLRCLVYFLVGSLFWVNRSSISLNATTTIICIILTLISCLFNFINYFLPIPFFFLLLLVVYKVPFISLKKIGDLSFAVYLYGWPIQQLVWTQGQAAYVNFFYSSLIIIPLAYLSWHCVENPALNLRKYIFKNKH